MKTIAIANQKGGVAKTTTALALGFGLASRGKRTLLVDLDPQGSLSEFLHVDTLNRPTVLEFLGIQAKHRAYIDTVKVSVAQGLDVIPSDISLEAAVGLLIGKIDAPTYLASALKRVSERYDYCIIDTSPSLSVITWNAFIAADGVIVPIKPEEASLKGVRLLLETLSDARRLKPEITVDGFLITMYDARRKGAKAILEKVQDIADENKVPVYLSVIRASASGAVVNGNPLLVPKLPIAEDYNAFIDEFLRTQGGN